MSPHSDDTLCWLFCLFVCLFFLFFVFLFFFVPLKLSCHWIMVTPCSGCLFLLRLSFHWIVVTFCIGCLFPFWLSYQKIVMTLFIGYFLFSWCVTALWWHFILAVYIDIFYWLIVSFLVAMSLDYDETLYWLFSPRQLSSHCIMMAFCIGGLHLLRLSSCHRIWMTLCIDCLFPHMLSCHCIRVTLCICCYFCSGCHVVELWWRLHLAVNFFSGCHVIGLWWRFVFGFLFPFRLSYQKIVMTLFIGYFLFSRSVTGLWWQFILAV